MQLSLVDFLTGSIGVKMVNNTGVNHQPASFNQVVPEIADDVPGSPY